MKTAAETMREMEEFKAANDQMYNNAGEWKYEEATTTNTGNGHVFSRNVAAEPPRSKTLIMASTIPPSMMVVAAATRNNNHAQKTTRGRSEGEARRQKRVVRYKSYAVESRVRASLNSGLRWLKNLV